ncbi:MAG: 3-phosphoshikimate 1-carboxyvinyltransferase, partial [Bacteroidales bacterium]|nr:3-phosphoshikimate 1-carboxyvinyltransferase [Bacteroidales bacterium]
LILLALRCEGTSKINAIERLKNKESNRAATFVEELRKLGADITVDKNTIAVKGSFNNRLHGAKVSSHGDHRLALALKVAQLIADGPVEIDDTQCISKSWPDFNLEV